MDEPQAEQLVETLDHCGAPRAAGGADTSQAWYQLRARKRATFAKKIVIPSRYLSVSLTGRVYCGTLVHQTHVQNWVF